MMDHLDRVLKRKRGLHQHFMIILGCSRILRITLSTVLLRLINMCLVDYFLYIFTWMLFIFRIIMRWLLTFYIGPFLVNVLQVLNWVLFTWILLQVWSLLCTKQ
ncbi:hypothetical protein Patl1_27543 [Pistacia atlantica]|uniref:Uncharacterized protein n=1 Tax=Pistacia atlantica TaxID=434234 RepID=A0ACC1BDQ4_9ROSI|nr:hypothetical protein Patl1_27543 [Pistacia atlantica]